MTQFVTVDRATLEQALAALYDTTGLPSTDARSFDNRIMSIRALRAALANAERVEPDTQRLDFMFLYDAFLLRTKTDADTIAYQLLAQDEDEDYVVLSGEDKFFPTGRAAVDAAREKAKP